MGLIIKWVCCAFVAIGRVLRVLRLLWYLYLYSEVLIKWFFHEGFDHCAEIN